MHKPISRYLAFLLLFTLSLHACQKAPEPGPEPEPREGAWTKVHYRAAVSGSAVSRHAEARSAPSAAKSRSAMRLP